MATRADIDRWRPVALSLVVAFFQVFASFGAADGQPDRDPIDAVAVLLLIAGPVALLTRRRHPVAVSAVTMAVTLTFMGLGYPYGPIYLSLIIALGTTVTSGHRPAAWLVAAGGFVGYLSLGVVFDEAESPTLLHAGLVAAWLSVVVVVADIVRVTRERVAESEHARAEQARRQASEERLRIAQELHDVLAHNISLINVQAGVALHLLDERPEQAQTALVAIKDASKEALGELRSVLGVLRQADEDTAPRSPAPSLTRLDDLIARSAAAGLQVTIEVEGAPRPLPTGIDLAAFRIVQEALTNVTRHSGASRATVRLVYGDQDLIVQVDDDGIGRTSPARPTVGTVGTVGTGSGIVGMQERATALGGELVALPRPGGGFRVRARLPLEPAS